MTYKFNSIPISRLVNKTLFMFRLSIFLLLGFILSGCSGESAKIDMVKNGTLNFDESKTINDVFKNNQMLSNQEWEFFEADDGSHVIQFKSDIDSSMLNSGIADFSKKTDENPVALIALAGSASAAGTLKGILALGYKFEKCSLTQQFLLSKANDDEFQVGNTSVNYSVNRQDRDGKIINLDGSFDDDDKTILEGLYDGDEGTGTALYIIGKVYAKEALNQLNETLK